MNHPRKRRGLGCLGEILFPIIAVTAIAFALFWATGTSLPALNASGLLPARRAASGQPGAISPIFTSGVQRWSGKIVEWEQRYNVDRTIIATIMQIESCGDETATGGAGEASLFQVMPFHFASGENPYDPDTNAARAMNFFTRMHEYTGYNVYMTFAGYNGGYEAAKTSYQFWPQHTQTYYTLARGIYDDAKAGLSVSPTIQSAVAGKRCPP